ncbi:MAG: glycoside hydrolase family 3 C-terminal domain-containing protein, partial [Candidatus Omnitrophica bacterium]|nr:glycoside hydrolase family 3 C-terminal domain-containing protein [Candidatus Omnitrophota bacterium]
SAALADLEGDRAGLSLAPVQVSLLETLAATGKPVILLIMTGSAVDLSWAQENLPAILLQFYPGQEGGTAL